MGKVRATRLAPAMARWPARSWVIYPLTKRRINQGTEGDNSGYRSLKAYTYVLRQNRAGRSPRKRDITKAAGCTGRVVQRLLKAGHILLDPGGVTNPSTPHCFNAYVWPTYRASLTNPYTMPDKAKIARGWYKPKEEACTS